jgi:dihydropteroate synthase
MSLDRSTERLPAPPRLWQTARFAIELSRPQVMGIVNVTPDSFSDGGRHADAASAIAHCERLLAEGADILDIGGESTRPGAAQPGVDEELARVLPVLRHAVTLGVPVSVDTSRPEVMRAALDAGADIVNDVRALRRSGALAIVAAHPAAGVCLMHMRGEPGSMQTAPDYDDVVAEVGAFLERRAVEVQAAGVARERIAIDPGIGFGKSAQHNLELLARQRELLATGRPLLVGWSRKSTLGAVTGRPVGERLAASVAAALLAVERGAAVVRVHDVAATVDALRLWRAATLRPEQEQMLTMQATARTGDVASPGQSRS